MVAQSSSHALSGAGACGGVEASSSDARGEKKRAADADARPPFSSAHA
jgi:hypothetical protein